MTEQNQDINIDRGSVEEQIQGFWVVLVLFGIGFCVGLLAAATMVVLL